MTKVELIAEIAKRCEITKVDAQECYDDVIGVISDLIAEGNEISLPEIGKFKLSTRSERVMKERTMKSAKSGKEITIPEQTIPACKAISFKPSKELKELVKQLPV